MPCSAHACRDEAEASQWHVLEKWTGVILEMQPINSMLHKDQKVSYSSIGHFDQSFELDCCVLRSLTDSLVRGGL